MDVTDLQSLLAQFQPSQEDKDAARRQAILTASLGLLGARKGQEFQRLGDAGLLGVNSYQAALQNAGTDKMRNMQAASQAMSLQDMMQKFQDDAKARQILMGTAAPAAQASTPSFGMGDRSNGAATPAPTAPPSGQDSLYKQLLKKADDLEAGGLPQRAQEYRIQAEKYAPKYKSMETVMDPNTGKPVLLQTFENQAPAPTQYAPKPDYKEVNMGDQRMFYDPVLGKEGAIFRVNQSPDSVASNQVAMRGQDLTDARARELRADTLAQQGKPQIVSNPQTGELYAVDPRTASGTQVMGPDGKPLSKGEKPLTEQQGNATAFGMRMKAANDIVNGLEKQGWNTASPVNLLAANPVANYVAPPQAQQLYQAKLNFMTASLRKESGAAISKSEFDSEDKKYFPQPGDSKQVMAQKAAMRDLALRAMAKQAGQQGAREFQAPSIDDLVKKYAK